MKIAVVLTVKNESRLLRNNLLYHHAIGVTKAFVYFDGTTDNGKNTIKDLDFVEMYDSVSPNKFQKLECLNKFTSQTKEHHTARQCLNTYDATQKCQALGYDWLISIDADELIATNENKPSNLKMYFLNLDASIDVVNFKTLEVLQQQADFGNVFAHAELFKTRKNFKYRGENVFRKIYNPSHKTMEKHYYWYGQTMGKAAFKIKSELIPKNVHRYVTQSGNKPQSIQDGFVLHYHAYDAQDFIKKFRNFSAHPTHFLSGNRVEPLKLLLKDVVNNHGYSDEQLKEYFIDYLLFKPKEVRNLLKNKKFNVFKRKQPVLKRVNSAIKVFGQIQNVSDSENNNRVNKL